MRANVLKCVAATMLVLAVVSLQTQSAYAQDPTTTGDRLKGDIAGTIGLGLLGAELGLLLPPAFKLQDQWWAWVLFPAAFGAGGAVAGVFAFEPRDPEPAITISILGAGMLLAVPAVVGASAVSSSRRSRHIDQAQGGGLLHFGKGGPRVGAPAIGSAPVFSAGEQARFGLPQRGSVRVGLLSGRF